MIKNYTNKHKKGGLSCNTRRSARLKDEISERYGAPVRIGQAIADYLAAHKRKRNIKKKIRE